MTAPADAVASLPVVERLPSEVSALLEPAAMYRGAAEIERVADHEIGLSIAISLKRLADALDGTTLGVDISESLAGVTTELTRHRP